MLYPLLPMLPTWAYSRTVGTVQRIDRARRVEDISRELAAVARELAEHCLAADLAVARNDFDCLCSSSEHAQELLARWALLYRELLVKRRPAERLTEYSSL